MLNPVTNKWPLRAGNRNRRPGATTSLLTLLKRTLNQMPEHGVMKSDLLQKCRGLYNHSLMLSTQRGWSGRWDSNPRPQPWQGCALPLSYARSHASQRSPIQSNSLQAVPV